MTVTTQGNTRIVKMAVSELGNGSTLNLGVQTTVDGLNLDGRTDVRGQGTVTEAVVTADRVTYERAPISQTVASGVVIPPVVISPPSGGSDPVTVPVSGVSLNKTAMTLLVNGKETLTATVAPTAASNKAVSWTSSDATVATVDASTGEVTAVAEGTAEITATSAYDSTKKATGLVTVKSNVLIPEINGITVPFDGDHPVMAITETDQYSGTVTWKQDATALTADSVFDGSKRYTATITLSLKPPYAAAMISNSYFTVAGAIAYNSNLSTMITATFYPIAQYRVNETGILTAYSGPGGVLAVPEISNLTGVGAAAFANKNLTEISLPDTVQTVADGAFAGNSLTKITLGAEVGIVDDTAMGVNGASFKTAYDTGDIGQVKRKGNYSLSNGTWHYSGNQVDQLWFDDAGLLSNYTGTSQILMIPDGHNITAIAPQAIAGRGINTLSLPNTVKTIGDGAFKDNYITDITIGSGVTVGADNALGGDTASFLTAYAANGAGNYHCYFEIVHNTPNWYYSDATANGMAFNKVTQTINSYMGAGGNLTIPASIDGTVVKIIFNNSFRSKNITGLVFDSGSQLTTIKAGAFYLNSIPTVALPNTVEMVEGSAFQSCHISNLALSSSLTTIEPAAFMSNELSEITIPDSVTSIGQQAFIVNKLTKVVIEGTGDGNLTIGKGAFQAFSQADSNPIIEITIPDHVTISDEDGIVAMGKYGAAFKSFYDDPLGNDQTGGTFTYDTGTSLWTKK
ncbi:MAG: leucine-rich repeat protein, partial [Firmicutes bacterium]|nr:leucine-rich repeat protein [Bacillota bacterium]